jgi:hypothetical protein
MDYGRRIVAGTDARGATTRGLIGRAEERQP